MKRTYLLIIYSMCCVEVKRIVCSSQKQAKEECKKFADGFGLVTGDLFDAEYDTTKGDYIPKHFVKRFHY